MVKNERISVRLEDGFMEKIDRVKEILGVNESDAVRFLLRTGITALDRKTLDGEDIVQTLKRFTD